MPRSFKITRKDTKYQNEWLVLKEYEILRDNEPGTYAVIERSDSVIIIASTADHRILFEKQYRFPTESYSWELPMGSIDPGEGSSEAANRELREETGLVTSLSKIGEFRPVPGLTPQTATVFTASIPAEAISSLESFDENVDEIIERRLLTFEEIQAKISSGEISDGMTLSALALYKLR